MLIGDALVNEHERLQTASTPCSTRSKPLKQALRIAATQENLKPDADFGALANLLRCYAVGRWEQYARSGFSREPLAQWPQQWPMLYLPACPNPAHRERESSCQVWRLSFLATKGRRRRPSNFANNSQSAD